MAQLLKASWRETRRAVLHKGNIAEFHFRQYMFACQARLLLKLELPAEVLPVPCPSPATMKASPACLCLMLHGCIEPLANAVIVRYHLMPAPSRTQFASPDDMPALMKPSNGWLVKGYLPYASDTLQHSARFV